MPLMMYKLSTGTVTASVTGVAVAISTHVGGAVAVFALLCFFFELLPGLMVSWSTCCACITYKAEYES